VNLKAIPFKRSAKLLALLLTSMLIATVSAITYLQLTMSSTVAVYKSNVYFVIGSDDGTKGLTVTLDGTNTTATLTGLRAYPNASFTYSDPVKVRNNATAIPNPQIRLAPDVNPSANPEDFVYVKFLLNATAVGDRRWLNYTSNGSTWSNTGTTAWVTIPFSTQWSIAVITKATAGASENHSVTITIKVDVD